MHVSYDDLYTREGLEKLDARFLASLQTSLQASLLAARKNPPSGKEESLLILALAPYLERFIGDRFGILPELAAKQEEQYALSPIFQCKRLLVQRRAAKAYKPEEVAGWRFQDLGFSFHDELQFAKQALPLLEPDADAAQLEAAIKYAAWALYHPDGIAKHKHGVLFKLPKRTDPEHLIELVFNNGAYEALPGHFRDRDGFKLTDDGGTLAEALDHANYCIFCANQGKDSCSKGIKNSEKHGCPLEEHISEMNELKAGDSIIGALAVVTIANPMCAGTGHRICNDCMKACIYQKQEPVNIPKVETRVLNDVLALPYGFEIYSLLTRWNPLNFKRPLPLPASGKSVLVAGLGPAGYTLSHYLLNEGHAVYAVDGLKIEQNATPRALIKDVNTLYQPLDERVQAGFGGVAEYGITVRWNKNYLQLIRLLLERREHFRMQGGVRFGSQISTEDAFALGFDHVALCLGAGKPTLLNIPNGFARGVRAASDFLMSLQLTGAAKKNSIANLHLRLPIVVIGGGLTAIDTATEALAYYAVQVEKFLARYEQLGTEALKNLTEEESALAAEWIDHARTLRGAENKLALLQQWGGATILYRKRLQDAPSYRLNHEEVEKAFEEGIRFIENAEPIAFSVDTYGHVCSVDLKDKTIPARSVLIAAGTSPNTVLAREEPEHYSLEGKYFARKEDGFSIYTRTDRRSVTMFGDLHPEFAGNVVKAMASAKAGYPVISAMLQDSGFRIQDSGLFDAMDDVLTATVERVERLTPTIVEVVIRAPQAAKKFKPGQFFRLQNYETPNPQMEGLALTGAWVDVERGLVSTIVLEMGGSSNLCANFTPGERVVLMGPTGEPTHIPTGETVVLVGGGLGNAVLFSIGKAMRDAGNRVIYFAGYKHLRDRFRVADIEAAADIVIWACDEAPGFEPSRDQDSAFTGNIIAAMRAHRALIESANRLVAIGSDGMMAAVKAVHKELITKPHAAIGSINSPMQCMMKEICAQCIQEHVSPSSVRSFVFSCTNQDQGLDEVNFDHLKARLNQNSLQEKLTAAYLSASFQRSV